MKTFDTWIRGAFFGVILTIAMVACATTPQSASYSRPAGGNVDRIRANPQYQAEAKAYPGLVSDQMNTISDLEEQLRIARAK